MSMSKSKFEKPAVRHDRSELSVTSERVWLKGSATFSALTCRKHFQGEKMARCHAAPADRDVVLLETTRPGTVP
jgi:hypothetical protein